MPSGSKKRRALRKREAAAAAEAREKNENDATPTDTSKENSPVMRTESTDGVTAVFDEPSVVLPKRTVLPEKMLAFEGLEKRKETEEGIKENALPAEIHSSDQSSNVAEPLETSQADKIDVVVESSVVATPCVSELDSQDKDGGSIMATDVCDFEGKETKDATKHLQADDVGSIMASDAVKSLTTEPCDFDLNAALNAENASNVNAEEDQRALEHKEDNAVKKKQNLVTPENRVDVENQETAALNEDDALGKTEKAFQLGEVEAAVQNKEDAISDDVKEIEIDTLKAAAENQFNAAANKVDASEAVEVQEVEAAAKNQEDDISWDVGVIGKNTLEAAAEDQLIAAPNKVDASEKVEAVEVQEVEAAAKNQEDVISWDVGVIGKNTLEAAAVDQLTAAPKEVDAPQKTEEAVSVDDVEAVIAAKPAELVTPEVGKQLKELKEMVEDVQNRLNAIDSMLHILYVKLMQQN